MFCGRVQAWRRQLHKWDPAGTPFVEDVGLDIDGVRTERGSADVAWKIDTTSGDGGTSLANKDNSNSNLEEVDYEENDDDDDVL